MINVGEPSLNPPTDRDLDMAHAMVEGLTDDGVIEEIVSCGLEDRAKKELMFLWTEDAEKTIGEPLPTKTRKVLQALLDASEFSEAVYACCEKDEFKKLREMLVDYKYHRMEK